jgi:hypothetical protein
MLDNYIGRIVAFVLTPILLPLMGALAFWLQDVAGVDMDPEVATGFVVSVVVGLALAVWQWLKNRGNWETQAENVLASLDAGVLEGVLDDPVEDPEAEDVPLDDLPDDETEFATPPPELHDGPGTR